MAATGVHQQRRLVRVWFGEHVVVNKTADEAFANRLAEAMQRRFSSLTVTNDPWPSPNGVKRVVRKILARLGRRIRRRMAKWGQRTDAAFRRWREEGRDD